MEEQAVSTYHPPVPYNVAVHFLYEAGGACLRWGSWHETPLPSRVWSYEVQEDVDKLR